MKKITLLLFAIFSLTFSWQSMAQSVSTQNFATSGSDSTPTVLTINSSDITVNQGQPIQQVVLGTFNGLYFGSDECGNYFDFDLSVTAGTADGTVIANGCDADFNGLDVTGFTTITITSNDIDNWTDTVDFDIDLEVTYQTPSCITPLSMSSTSVTSSTVDLTWSAGASGESPWNLEWKAGADFTPGNAEEDASDSASGTAAYNATGLSPNTTYYFYYQADCGGGDTSDWVGPFVVTTLCAAIVPDYTADMSNNPVDVCWTEANNGDVTSGPTDLGSGLWYASNHNGTPSNAINLWSDVRSDWIISPTFDLSTSAPSELNVYVALTEGSTSGSDADLGSDDSVDLLMTTDGGTTWTSLQTWTQGNVPTDIGEQITYDLSAVTGTVQFAFLGDEGDVDDTEDVYFHVSQFRVRETPSCVEPSNLDILNLTSTSVDLLWSAGGSESIWNVEIVDLTAGGTVTGTATDTGVSNPFSVSGLTPNNDYEFYVQADCGGGDTSAWVGPFSFSTLCNPITSYPWSEDFESVSTPDLPSCWSHINNNGDTDNWQTYTTYGVGGSTTAGLYTDFNSGNNDDYLVLPQFTLTGNERLKFSVRARSSSEPNDYRVVLSTSGSTPTDFTEELLPLTQVSSTTQTEIAPIDLSSYTGDVYIAIHVPSGGLDGYYIYFDEFVVEPIPSCVEPSNLTATNIMTTSADLGWTENGSASSYNVEVVEAGNAPTGTATDTGVANGFTKSGLLPSVTYDYYVQADCTGGDVSIWVGPYTFTTLCEPFAASYTQNFDAESTPDINSCWSTILENPTTTFANIITSTTESVSASNSVRFYNSSDSTSDFYLVSPNFSDLDNTKRVVFQLYQNQGTSDEGDVVEVGTMTDPSDASTYTTFQTITYEERTEDSWTNIVVNFDTYAGTDNYVAIKINFGGTYNYYYMDDFVYEEIPSCLEPSDLTATNIMATSADLGWTENGTASTYNVEVLLAGDAATGTATDTGVANGFTKSGLADNTDYEYYVQAICGGDTSAWSGPYAFTTLCAAIVPNYIADFSTIAPSCWTEGNDTDVATGPDGNNGGWINDDFLNTAGIEAAKFNLYSDFQQDWLVSPVFDFSSGGYGLAFDVGVTAWNSTVAETPNLMGSDDEVLLLISEDNGVTWTTLEAFNVENAPSHTGDNKIYDLSTITSSTVKFAFWATDGSVDDAEDIDFFVANFNVNSYATLGVSEVEDKATFTYYPNPVNNNLNLSSQKEINNVSVYNMVGQEVFRSTPNTMTDVVDMSGLQAGAYFVKVTVGNATKTVKVIKK